MFKRSKQIRKLEVIGIKSFLFSYASGPVLDLRLDDGICGRQINWNSCFLFSQYSLSVLRHCFQEVQEGLFTLSIMISHTIQLKLYSNGWKNSRQREKNSAFLYAGQPLKHELYLCVIHHGLKLSSCTLIKGWTIHKHCYYGESVMILALESSFPDLDELWLDCPLSIRLVLFCALTQNVVVSKAAKNCLVHFLFHCCGICFLFVCFYDAFII